MKKYRWHSETRYYCAYLYQDLFGDWIVNRSWGGRYNELGGAAYQVFENRETAEEALSDIAKTRQKRAYSLIRYHA